MILIDVATKSNNVEIFSTKRAKKHRIQIIVAVRFIVSSSDEQICTKNQNSNNKTSQTVSYGNISFNIFIQYKTKQTDQIETGGGSVLKKPLRGDCSTNSTPFFSFKKLTIFTVVVAIV